MYDVGGDGFTLRDGRPMPKGLAHAVDRDGAVLCRAERPRYYSPWLDWRGDDPPDEDRAAACPECTAVALERALPPGAAYDPYPAAAAEVPAQPAIDWLGETGDFTA